MKRINFFILLTLIASSLGVSAQSWSTDILGHGYESATIDMGRDYSGKIDCTLIRLNSNCSKGRAVLYVHGFNDYFFQTEMGEEFTGHCFNFYAVDLRKYGRSLRQGQVRGQLRNMDEYCADIDTALNIMQKEGAKEIVLLGHSTGGLAAAYYIATHPDSPVKALILNSPFLDWNLGNLECFINLVSASAAILPSVKIDTGGSNTYSHSLLKKYHGEWEFDTVWKNPNSTVVDLRWVRAINAAQHKLRKLKDSIHIPVLVMHSTKSVNLKEWAPEANEADAVLDVKDIDKYGRLLGNDVTMIALRGGLHDLALSSPRVRAAYYSTIFSWLQKEGI